LFRFHARATAERRRQGHLISISQGWGRAFVPVDWPDAQIINDVN